jgi:outer membrane autotransporter protein
LDNLSDPENIGKYSYDVRKVAPSAMFALNQLSGAIYATMETASFQNNSIILSQLADYLRSDPLLTYCKDCRVYEPSKLDLWAATYGTLGGSDHDGNAYGYDQSTGGTIIGFDRLYIKQTRVGIFGTFGSSTYNTDLLEKSKATDISAGLYARKDLNRGYLLGSIGFGYTDYHTTRRILFANQRAKSDRDAYFWSAYIERALDLDSQIGRIQPYIGAQYIGNQFNNFNETGAGTLSLQGGSSDAHSLRSILGARFTRHPRLVRGGKLETFLNFDWKLEFLGYTKGNLKAHFTNPNSENFAGSGSFHVYGNKQNRSWLDAGIGSNWDRNNTRISLGYNIGINGNGFFLHTGNIAFTYAR